MKSHGEDNKSACICMSELDQGRYSRLRYSCVNRLTTHRLLDGGRVGEVGGFEIMFCVASSLISASPHLKWLLFKLCVGTIRV